MIQIDQLEKTRLPEIKEFIPEELDRAVEKFDAEKDIIFAAGNGKQICGIVWGHQFNHKDEHCYHIVFLQVSEPFRRQGIGTLLFKRAIEDAEKRKVGVLRTNFKESETFPASERLLETYGWEKPEPTMYYCRSTVEKFFNELTWTKPSRYTAYDSYLYPWSEITEEDLETIRKTEGRHFAQNEASDHLWDKEKVETINSFILRDGETLMGWLVSHRHKPDTLHYTSIYIFDEYRGSALFRAVIVKALSLQQEAGIPKWSWLVSATDKKVMKLWNLLFHRIVTKSDKWYQSKKDLPSKS